MAYAYVRRHIDMHKSRQGGSSQPRSVTEKKLGAVDHSISRGNPIWTDAYEYSKIEETTI